MLFDDDYKGPERRKSDLSAHDKIVVISQYLDTINDRISSHKKDQDTKFEKIQECVDRIESILIPKDGDKKTMPERLRNIESYIEDRKKEKDRVVNHIYALWVAISGCIVKFLFDIFAHVK
jgi:hypothetical protein